MPTTTPFSTLMMMPQVLTPIWQTLGILCGLLALRRGTVPLPERGLSPLGRRCAGEKSPRDFSALLKPIVQFPFLSNRRGAKSPKETSDFHPRPLCGRGQGGGASNPCTTHPDLFPT